MQALALPPERPGDAEAREYEAARTAHNTKRAYQSGWELYCGWCRAQGCDPLGQHVDIDTFADQVRRYLSLRKRSGRKYATVKMDLVIINQARVAASLEEVRRKPAIINLMLGLRRNMRAEQESVRKMKAITPDILRAMLNALPDTLWGVRDKALLLLGFACGMRRSEICELMLESVQIFPRNRLIVKITHSKTDQEWEGRFVEVGALPDRFMCPVEAVEAWVAAAGLRRGPDVPLFPGIRNGEHMSKKTLVGNDVRVIIQKTLRRAGINPEGFSGHSLRAGLVTTLKDNGASNAQIMAITGHTTEAMVEAYYRRSEVPPNLTAMLFGPGKSAK